jgi:hypothetical protein
LYARFPTFANQAKRTPQGKGKEEWMPDTIQWTLNFCAGMCVALLFEVVRIQIKVDDIEKRLIPQDQKEEGEGNVD